MNLKNNLTYLRINAEKYYFLKILLKKFLKKNSD